MAENELLNQNAMVKIINPFIVSGKIEPDFFCDRVKESEYLIKTLTNGNNIVLISPRRMGKTGLIRHCYDATEIAGNCVIIQTPR